MNKEDALNKMNTFLSLSCFYNIIPDQVKEVTNKIIKIDYRSKKHF